MSAYISLHFFTYHQLPTNMNYHAIQCGGWKIFEIHFTSFVKFSAVKRAYKIIYSVYIYGAKIHTIPYYIYIYWRHIEFEVGHTTCARVNKQTAKKTRKYWCDTKGKIGESKSRFRYGCALCIMYNVLTLLTIKKISWLA